LQITILKHFLKVLLIFSILCRICPIKRTLHRFCIDNCITKCYNIGSKRSLYE